jgi:16S rRNA (guanine527-N7)-methyltransferase
VSNGSAWPTAFEERFGVSRESGQKLSIYADLLAQWQARINLVAPSTMAHSWERHFADSLQLLPFLQAGQTVAADLGSGAGFPGLVLACVRDITVHLYESNGKKTAFLQDVIRQTGAKGLVHKVRLETLSTENNIPKVDTVLARALAPLSELLEYAEPFLSRGAIGLFLKGSDVDNELTAAAKSWTIDYRKHASMTDSRGVVLEVREVSRVTD